MKRTMCVLVAVALGVTGALAGTILREADSLRGVLPPASTIEGWAQAESARVYEGEDLYAFIDGGADLFFEYGFRRSLRAEYQNLEGESITLEIYQMTDSSAAYGIYSVRSGEKSRPLEIGQGGCEGLYYIMFWKGAFYVSIAASDTTRRCRSGLASMARAVATLIPVRGSRPYLVNLLPPKGLEKERYVRGNLGLSSALVLGIKELFPVQDGVIGTYRDHVLVFMRYGSTALALHRAEEVLASLKSSKLFEPLESQNSIACFKHGENQILCCAQSGKYVVLSLSSVESLAEASCLQALLWLRKHG